MLRILGSGTKLRDFFSPPKRVELAEPEGSQEKADRGPLPAQRLQVNVRGQTQTLGPVGVGFPPSPRRGHVGQAADRSAATNVGHQETLRAPQVGRQEQAAALAKNTKDGAPGFRGGCYGLNCVPAKFTR